MSIYTLLAQTRKALAYNFALPWLKNKPAYFANGLIYYLGRFPNRDLVFKSPPGHCHADPFILTISGAENECFYFLLGIQILHYQETEGWAGFKAAGSNVSQPPPQGGRAGGAERRRSASTLRGTTASRGLHAQRRCQRGAVGLPPLQPASSPPTRGSPRRGTFSPGQPQGRLLGADGGWVPLTLSLGGGNFPHQPQDGVPRPLPLHGAAERRAVWGPPTSHRTPPPRGSVGPGPDPVSPPPPGRRSP